MRTQRLYLYVGYPGSGKTTVSQIIHERTGAEHIWADKERTTMFINPRHTAEESAQLYTYLNEKTAELLAAGKSVIFDTNFNFRADRDYLRAIAQRYQAETMIIWLTTPKALAKQRATHDDHRQRNGYHEIMSEADFDRLSDHMQVPGPDERWVQIDGTDIDKQELCAALDI